MKAKLFSATVCLLTIFMVTAACGFPPAAVKDDLQTQAQRLLQKDSGDLKQLMQGHDFKAIVVLPLIFFFADVTGDGIPELFWGHFDTSITNSAWFHGYSLSEHRPMQAIHSGEAWSGVPCGETEEEALKNALDAKKAWLEAALEENIEIPEPDSLEAYSGQFKLRLPRSLHRALAEHSQREGISMNQYCVYLLAKNDALHAG